MCVMCSAFIAPRVKQKFGKHSEKDLSAIRTY